MPERGGDAVSSQSCGGSGFGKTLFERALADAFKAMLGVLYWGAKPETSAQGWQMGVSLPWPIQRTCGAGAGKVHAGDLRNSQAEDIADGCVRNAALAAPYKVELILPIKAITLLADLRTIIPI